MHIARNPRSGREWGRGETPEAAITKARSAMTEELFLCGEFGPDDQDMIAEIPLETMEVTS